MDYEKALRNMKAEQDKLAASMRDKIYGLVMAKMGSRVGSDKAAARKFAEMEKKFKELQNMLDKSGSKASQGELQNIRTQVDGLEKYMREQLTKPNANAARIKKEIEKEIEQSLTGRITPLQKKLDSLTSKQAADERKLKELDSAAKKAKNAEETVKKFAKDVEKKIKEVKSEMAAKLAANSGKGKVDSKKIKDEMDAKIAGLMKDIDGKINNKAGQKDIKKTERDLKDVLDKLSNLKSDMNTRINNIKFQGGATTVAINGKDIDIDKIVAEKIEIYNADKTGEPDYALYAPGGRILSHSRNDLKNPTSRYIKENIFSYIGMQDSWAYAKQSALQVIKPHTHPGDCWAFKGDKGWVHIKLWKPVIPKSVTLEHVSRLTVQQDKVMPKDFKVYGSNDTTAKAEFVELGGGTFDREGSYLQTFPIDAKGTIYKTVKIEIMSNHGDPTGTCLYRVRVHGIDVHPEDFS
eukprot:1358777-Amorphochlora_amoeboformis.AAC.1